VSCCSDVIFGKPAPNIPGNVKYLAPGPIKSQNRKRCKSDLGQFKAIKNIYSHQILSAKRPLNKRQRSILLKLN